MALQELGVDYTEQINVTATITAWDDRPRIADEKLQMAETINAVGAWLGSLPGHGYADIRQPPTSTLNLARMIPLSATWTGPERDEHRGR